MRLQDNNNPSIIQKIAFQQIRTARLQCTRAGYERLMAEEDIRIVM